MNLPIEGLSEHRDYTVRALGHEDKGVFADFDALEEAVDYIRKQRLDWHWQVWNRRKVVWGQQALKSL